ncbi:MAG TPA: hypothetical protein VF532_06475 [Candidatus Angelobacter sp.]
MDHWLNAGTEQERIHKLVSLGFAEDEAQLAVQDLVQWQPIRSESRHGLAILFVPCGGLASASLYLLERGDRGWHVKDSVGFDCHYDDSVSFETVPLRNSNVDDVLVHHECEGHGTGILQQNFNVFIVTSGKFKIVLNTEEVVNGSALPVGSYELRQRSKFTALPGAGIILETRCTNVNGRVSIQDRQFKWHASRSRFRPSRFVMNGAIAKKMGAVCR